MKQRITPQLILAIVACSLALNTAWATQVCNSAITPTAPASDFTLKGDGTAIHNATGLMWMRCSLGQTFDSATDSCTGTATKSYWSEALAAAESTDFAGYNDWRLPNIKELISIVERACYTPAIDETVFPNTQNYGYWSSSPYAYYSDSVWRLDFSYGSDYHSVKDDIHPARLVRGQ